MNLFENEFFYADFHSFEFFVNKLVTLAIEWWEVVKNYLKNVKKKSFYYKKNKNYNKNRKIISLFRKLSKLVFSKKKKWTAMLFSKILKNHEHMNYNNI